MRWQTVKKLKPPQFKRLVGVKYETFEKMVSEAKRIHVEQPKKVVDPCQCWLIHGEREELR